MIILLFHGVANNVEKIGTFLRLAYGGRERRIGLLNRYLWNHYVVGDTIKSSAQK